MTDEYRSHRRSFARSEDFLEAAINYAGRTGALGQEVETRVRRGGARPLSFQGVVPPHILARFAGWSREHQERGCGGDTVAFSQAGVLMGACACTCPDHGCADLAADAARETVFCVRCRDTGMVRQTLDVHAPGFGKGQPCPECGETRRLEYLRLVSGIPWDWWGRYQLVQMDYQSGVRRAVEGWLRAVVDVQGDPGRVSQPFLVLTGQPGTGKTHAAIGCAFTLTGSGLSVWFSTAHDLLASIRRTYNAGSEASERTVLEPARAAACAIIDDLGAEKPSEWTEATMLDLINYRWSRQKLTIITSNLTRETAPDGRLWSRLLGERVSLVVESKGPDRRRA